MAVSEKSTDGPIGKEEREDGEARHPSDVTGDWGPVQQRILIVLTIVYMVAPFNNWGILFWTTKYDHYCHAKDPINNLTHVLLNECSWNSTTDGVAHECDSFTYDDSVYKRTLISTFDLVCDRAYYSSLAQSVHQLGYMISGNVIGYLSDRYGRLFAVRASILIEIIAGFGQAFAPSINWFLAARLLVGFSAYGRFLSSYVLIAEWCSPALRSRVLMIYELGYAVAKMMLPLCFWLYSDYFVMQVVVSIVEVVFLIAIVFSVWESPRWLLTNGRHKEAEELLRSAAKANGKLDNETIERKINEVIVNSEKEFASERKAAAKREGLLDVWRVPHLLKVSLILYYTWLVSSFVGYGSTFNISSLGGSVYISFALSSLSSLATGFLLVYAVDWFPRRGSIHSCLTVVALTLIALIAVSFNDDFYWIRLVLFFLFSAARSANYKIYYVYTTEVFPTTMRQTSLGTCSFFARIGSTVSPFVKILSDQTHVSVVFALFAGLMIVNVILFAFAPETGNIQLPDTVRQKEKEVEMRRLSHAPRP